jgi:nuclear pore complex protein Nup155
VGLHQAQQQQPDDAAAAAGFLARPGDVASPVLLQTLGRMLNSADADFHHALYDFVIGQEWLDLLLSMASPYLEEYLRRGKESDLGKGELLNRFFVRNGRYAEAAAVLADLSSYPGLGLNQRLEYLTMAVSNAKSSQQSDSSLVSGTLGGLPDQLDVAKIQLEIYNIIAEQQLGADLLAQLDASLYDLNHLYHHFVRPLELDEMTLLIFHAADHGAAGRSVVEGAWRSIVHKARAATEAQDQGLYEVLAHKVRTFGRRFYPDENVFPLRFLVDLLLKTSFEHGQESGAAPAHTWVVDVLCSLKVPMVLQFQILNDMFEAKMAPWSSHAGLLFLVEEIALFLHRWMSNLRRAPRGSFDRYVCVI